MGGAKASPLGGLNPFHYRGYYYDTESGLYYLNSRYYDPEIGRFLNADDSDILQIDQEQLAQYNLFAYCLNNPTNMIDSDGEFAITLSVVAAVTLLWGVTTAVCIYAVNTPQFQEGWKNLCTGIADGIRDIQENILYYKEHTKGARKSTQQKHQKGQSRKNKDSGGEKGDQRRTPNPNKRRPSPKPTPNTISEIQNGRKIIYQDEIIIEFEGGGAIINGIYYYTYHNPNYGKYPDYSAHS